MVAAAADGRRGFGENVELLVAWRTPGLLAWISELL